MWKYKRRIVPAVLAALGVALVAYAQQLPPPREAQEAMRRHRERTRGTVTAQEALFGVLRGLGVPGGFVLSPQCEEEERQTPPGGSSLRERLDSLVAAAPQYKWQAENGVVNVVPKSGLPALLEACIVRFRAESVRSPGEALVKLIETPEVREAMTRPDVGSRLFRGGVGYYDPNPEASESVKTFSVSRDNVTVREALNAIAREHGRAMWTHRQHHCRGVHAFELDFAVW